MDLFQMISKKWLSGVTFANLIFLQPISVGIALSFLMSAPLHAAEKKHVDAPTTVPVAKGMTPDTLGYAWKKVFAPPSISGYIQADYGHFSHENTKLGDRAVIRRAVLTVSGDTYVDWGYMFSIDDVNGTVKLENNYLSYKGFAPATLKIGQFKEYFSLEELTSSTNITFIERSLPVLALAPSYRIGIGLNTYGEKLGSDCSYTAAIGLFGQAAGYVPEEEGANQGGALTSRVTFAYNPTYKKLFLFGLAGSIRVPDSDHHLKYATTPESFVAGVTFLNTSQITLPDGDLEDADGIEEARYMGLYGLESALVSGPFSFQGEYIGSHVHQEDGEDSLNFRGWYLFATYFLTGESRAFDKKTALFTNITPLHSYGAWEVGMRFSYLNLNDEDIAGGSEHNTTVGLSWYTNPAVRFMANYTKVHASQNGVHNHPDIFTLRAQVSFG